MAVNYGRHVLRRRHAIVSAEKNSKRKIDLTAVINVLLCEQIETDSSDNSTQTLCVCLRENKRLIVDDTTQYIHGVHYWKVIPFQFRNRTSLFVCNIL